MKKSVRIGIAIVILFVLAVVAVRLFVPADSVETFLLKQLEERTGIVAEAEQASIQFPWPVGVRLKNLKLKPVGETVPGMPRIEGEIEEVMATADLFSLLRRKPQLQEIRLKRPRLEIWLPASGSAKSGGEAGSTASPAEKREGSIPPALALALLSVEDGQLTVHPAEGGAISVAGLSQRVHGWLKEDGTLSGRLAGRVEKLSIQEPTEVAPRELDGLSLDLLADGSLHPLNLKLHLSELSGEGWNLQGPFGLLQRGASLRLHADLVWEVQPTLVQKTGAAWTSAAAAWKLQWGFKSLKGTLKADGVVPGKDALPRDWLDLFSLQGELAELRVTALGQQDLVRGGLVFEQRGGAMQVKSEKLSCPGWTMHGRLDFPVLGEGTAAGHFEGMADAQALQELVISLWPQLPESLRTKVSAPAEWPRLTGGFEGSIDLELPLPSSKVLPSSAVRSHWVIGRLAVFAPNLPDSLVITKGSVDLDPSSAQFSEIGLVGPGLQGVLGGQLSGWEEDHPRFNGNLQCSRVDLDSLHAVEEGEKHASVSGSSGWASACSSWWKLRQARAEETGPPTASGEFPAPPENLSAEIDLRCERVFSRGYRIDDFSGHLSLQDRVMELNDLAGDLDGGRLSGKGRVDWTTPSPHWKVEMDVDGLASKAALAPLAPGLASALNTVLKGRFTLDGPLNGDRKLVLSRLSGGGSLQGSAGKLLTGELLASSLSSLPAGAVDKLREIPFHQFLARFRFEDGRAHFDEALLKGPTQVRAQGWVGFFGKVDTHLEVKLPPGESLDLGSLTPLVEFLRTSDKRITIPVRIKGEGGKPQLSLELDTARSRMQGEAKGSVKDKLRGLLKGLTGKKGGG